MEYMQGQKSMVLIADDSEINRSILADMLGDEYEIIEADNGVQALSLIKLHSEELSLILLDIVMPEADGFDVLEEMNDNGWIEEIPVIMISAENSASHIEKAYALGATDFISRPFDALIVHRRVVNTILLYSKQKKLIEIAAKQIYEKEKLSQRMIEVLSHILEFRNGESGLHVRRVRIITEKLLKRLTKKSDKYKLTRAEIATISTASALHDIGKIAIDEKILNKPGRLTKEEFEVIKTHSIVGAKMLEDLQIQYDDDLLKTAHEICRWHHERYDGSGYPDALTGDEIPLSAQIVALADVYDALTSDRVYKKAIEPDEAVRMIVNNECGKFNPILTECLLDIQDELKTQMEDKMPAESAINEAHDVIEEILQRDEMIASKRTLKLLEDERMKFDYFASLNNELQFEYSVEDGTVKFSQSGAKRLGFPGAIVDIKNDAKARDIMSQKDFKKLVSMILNATPDDPEVGLDCKIHLENEDRWFRIAARALWKSDNDTRISGAIGKAIDIHDSRMKLNALEKKASTDALTGLLNHSGAKELIKLRLSDIGDKKFALAIFDLDSFKQANDTYGHMFGDKVLVHTAQRLRQSIRGSDIMARVGGDEFLIFIEYKTDPQPIIDRIFNAITGKYEDFRISLSMGIATTETVGDDYDALFSCADKALYNTKRKECGTYRFYDDSIQGIFSVISPIDK